MKARASFPLLLCALAAACAAPEGKGLARAPAGTGAAVRFDVLARPLPDIPTPNDFATRYDASSPTGRRINASLVATTRWERATRASIDQLDGWGTYQSVTVAFDKPLDVLNIIKRQQGDDYDPSDDVAYLIDITPDSPDYCQRVPLDFGEGNFPNTLESPELYPNDLHNDSDQLFFEDREEDANHNGQLDLGEDLDMDGVLDHPNVLYPGADRRDLLTFYERETNTLIMKPVLPLRQNTTYAVVLTRRLLDEDGRPVRSPFEYVNHTSQTAQLQPLVGCLPKYGLEVSDLAFTWAYTTQSITRDVVAIRDGLYGVGPMQRLAAEFPGEVKELFRLKTSTDPGVNVRIVTGDELREVAIPLLKALGGSQTLSPAMQAIADSHKFIAYHVVLSFDSPQFFRRYGPDGQTLLPLYDQTWDLDPVTGAAFTRPETVYVWITIPKKHAPGAAPAMILGHGYTGSKLDPLFYGGFMARYGMACIGMENVSHGIGFDSVEIQLARSLFAPTGLMPFFDAVAGHHRAMDLNGDGVPDSGGDFWTAYVAHTRDVVRQSAVDYMQFIRVIRGFDGQRTWKYDLNHNGLADDLAGDFDGDGVVDLGGDAPIDMTGGSLGGIMSTLMAGAEPQLDVAVPVSAGAGLADIGSRSNQGSVVAPVPLRMMAPLMLTLATGAGGALELWQYLPNANANGKVKLAPVPGPLAEGSTAVLVNLTTQEHRCARVQAGGLLRVAVSSDQGDLLKLSVYPGPLPPEERSGCRVPELAVPSWEVAATGFDFTWQGVKHPAGEALTALGDGFGLRRQTPELRRFMGLAQLAMDRADPVNWIPFASRWNLRYGTGEQVRTRLAVVTTIGDPVVPVASGLAIARAGGFLPLEEKDPRWGKTPNRVLIDNHVVEGVERVSPYRNSQGQTVLMDVDDLSSLAGVDDGFDAPRLNPPFRLIKRDERLGGVTGMLLPMVTPKGRHGFDTPDPTLPFNVGAFIMNAFGKYMSTGGEELPLEGCMATDSCAWVPQPPQ